MVRPSTRRSVPSSSTPPEHVLDIPVVDLPLLLGEDFPDFATRLLQMPADDGTDGPVHGIGELPAILDDLPDFGLLPVRQLQTLGQLAQKTVLAPGPERAIRPLPITPAVPPVRGCRRVPISLPERAHGRRPGQPTGQKHEQE